MSLVSKKCFPSTVDRRGRPASLHLMIHDHFLTIGTGDYIKTYRDEMVPMITCVRDRMAPYSPITFAAR
ncbi:putative epoxide hydrolase [Fusarium oxysporum f. sp. albedinis]|nr:putative epoxide hydrolase [Fusarium oxysporum f. sp. albedinis]